MYNNETAGPAFEEFLDLLGQRVRLKGFSKYRAQLDNKSKSHIRACSVLQRQACHVDLSDSSFLYPDLFCHTLVPGYRGRARHPVLKDKILARSLVPCSGAYFVISGFTVPPAGSEGWSKG